MRAAADIFAVASTDRPRRGEVQGNRYLMLTRGRLQRRSRIRFSHLCWRGGITGSTDRIDHTEREFEAISGSATRLSRRGSAPRALDRPNAVVGAGLRRAVTCLLQFSTRLISVRFFESRPPRLLTSPEKVV